MSKKIIFGDNVFWGVNHANKKKGELVAQKYDDINNIVNLIKDVHSMGIDKFMFSSHDKMKNILKLLDKNDNLNTIKIYPNVPYLMKYVKKASQDGMLSLINQPLKQLKFHQKLIYLLKTSGRIIKFDITKLIEQALFIELMEYKKFNLPIIFLHNGITDLIIGLKGQELLRIYVDIIKNEFDSQPGFITLNPCILNDLLTENNIKDVTIMSPFNINGFHVNPSKTEVENFVCNTKYNFIPMNVMTSGILKPDIAFNYLSNYNNIKSVIIGTSNLKHLEENCKLIEKYIN